MDVAKLSKRCAGYVVEGACLHSAQCATVISYPSNLRARRGWTNAIAFGHPSLGDCYITWRSGPSVRVLVSSRARRTRITSFTQIKPASIVHGWVIGYRPCLDPIWGADSAQCTLNAHCSNLFIFSKNYPNFD
jgi:hypothetical protein